MKLLLDMNLSPSWQAFLDHAGHQAVHWSSVGRAEAPDTEIMAYAARENMVAIMHGLDFGAILAATSGRKPSVVQLRAADIRPAAIGRDVLSALEQCSSELTDGALLTIDAGRRRLSLLPLRL